MGWPGFAFAGGAENRRSANYCEQIMENCRSIDIFEELLGLNQ